MELKIRNDLTLTPREVEDWRTLVHTNPCQPFFMLPEYQMTWWKHLGHGKLEVLEFFEDGERVGIVPLYLDTSNNKQVYRLIGAMDESDYLDIIFKPTYANKIYRKLRTYLAHQKWDEVWLESLPVDSDTHTSFKTFLQEKGWHVTRKKQTVSPVITLPKTWDKYLLSLEPKFARNFKKLLSRIGEEDEIAYRVVTKPKEVAAAMPAFIKLHKASGPDKASFWNPEREVFFTEVTSQLAKHDLVKLYFLDVNGEPAATLLVFDYHNQFLVYNSGFDAYKFGYLGVSNALFLYTIQDALKLNRSRYDFMRGDEAYKFTFGAKSEPVYDLVIKR